MSRELIIGSKYFFDYQSQIFEGQIEQITDTEFTITNLNTNETLEYFKTEIKPLVALSDSELSSLNNNELYSCNSDTIEAIISRDELVNRIDEIDTNSVLITITDPGSAPISTETTNKFIDVLAIQFWDLEESFANYNVITEAEATIIRKFIEKHKDKKFVINCEAGMSRSAGVGLAVECIVLYEGIKYYHQTGSSAIKAHSRYHPNFVVYDKILDSNVK